ncbi:hypothetical protein SAMN05660420_00910 [Desulfuromusa kysingii]|uniref:Glutathionylspermidine synthase preATP-grasp n=1 Tax=Desulfuromusa kysingii TaxID=37625 RepID=A0A1H3XCG8_9BACT|nr:hypothetical protein [Desulfuromusa kysingii]SDZ96930.1 hypothetical protein SAMN05660420_00910 [Desulfuromusa kysingii]
MSIDNQSLISRVRAHIPRQDLCEMLRLVRLLFRVSQSSGYRHKVFPDLPEVARFDPNHAALMMGYDFHLTADGPRLIEVNTNAGGAYIAWLSEQQAGTSTRSALSNRFKRRLLNSFLQEWQDFSAADEPLKRVIIMDENLDQQALFLEMIGFRDWLCENGIDAHVASPEDLQVEADGVYFNAEKVDLIYNRHCDFFLETEPMQELKKAYLTAQVCLSPNPFAYGLLADKRRMVLWSDPESLDNLGLSARDTALLLKVVPPSSLLSGQDEGDLWSRRKKLIFKPVTAFGGRGVLLGKGITRKRFADLDPETTLVQQLVPPSVETSTEGQEYKMDVRLFVYRNHLLGVGARLYQGQVTNMKTAGGGFAPVSIV